MSPLSFHIDVVVLIQRLCRFWEAVDLHYCKLSSKLLVSRH